MATEAPRSASISADARAIPEAPPTTTAFLPLISTTPAPLEGVRLRTTQAKQRIFPAMSIAITDDHRALADTASDLLRKRDSRGAARALLEAPTEERPDLWKDLAGLGWLGLHV